MTKLIPILLILLCGCVLEPTREKTGPQTPASSTWDAATAAAAIAHQAELANESPAFKASEVLDGLLNQGVECGVPKDFADKVRKACPAIGAKPATDISADQVNAIRGVR